MRKLLAAAGATLLVAACASTSAEDNEAPPAPAGMSFFITSEANPGGANLGGLEGADAICQRLASAAGAGNRTWRAYLSAEAAGSSPPSPPSEPESPSTTRSRSASVCSRPTNHAPALESAL